VTSPDPADLRSTLRRDLTTAMKARDAAAVAALRSVLAAIENAAAGRPAEFPLAEFPSAEFRPGVGRSPIAGSVAGLGAAEVDRRELTDAELTEIVRAEVTDRRAAALEYNGMHQAGRSGQSDRADRLHQEADVLASYLPPDSR
jgi:uncharacterized protein YqeY